MNKKQKLAEYDQLVDAIEDAAVTPVWNLADWLVANVPNQGRGGDRGKTAQAGLVTIAELADRRGVSRMWLTDMRTTAVHFSTDVRVPGASLRAHKKAWERAKGDLDTALAALRSGGTLRDQGAAMESTDAIVRNLSQRTPEEQAAVAKAIVPNLAPTAKAEVAAKAFDTQEARHAADSLPSDDKANIIQAKTHTFDQQDRRNDDADAVRTGDADEAHWKTFKRHISPDFLRASAYLGRFKWTTERVAWMHETGDRIRDAFYETAARNAALSDDDFAALLEGDEE